MNPYIAVLQPDGVNFAIYTPVPTTDINGDSFTILGPAIIAISLADLQAKIADLQNMVAAITAAQGGATPAAQLAAQAALKTQ